VNWKRIVLAAAGFGAGLAIFATVIGAGIHRYANRRKPGKATAITAKFKKQVIYENREKPSEPHYYVNVYFNVSNPIAGPRCRSFDGILSNLAPILGCSRNYCL
jgi:hypothetical protein